MGTESGEPTIFEAVENKTERLVALLAQVKQAIKENADALNQAMQSGISPENEAHMQEMRDKINSILEKFRFEATPIKEDLESLTDEIVDLIIFYSELSTASEKEAQKKLTTLERDIEILKSIYEDIGSLDSEQVEKLFRFHEARTEAIQLIQFAYQLNNKTRDLIEAWKDIYRTMGKNPDELLAKASD